EHGVVGQGGREIGALVVTELADGATQRLPPGLLRQVGGSLRLPVLGGHVHAVGSPRCSMVSALRYPGAGGSCVRPDRGSRRAPACRIARRRSAPARRRRGTAP